MECREISPLYLLTHRNPVEVAQSLNRRDGLDLEYSYLLWLRHILDAEIGTRGAKRSFTSYRRLLEDWPAEIDKISLDLNVTWPNYDVSSLSNIEKMIRPDLKNFSDNQLIKSSIFSEDLKKTMEVFDRWAEWGENPSDYFLLDQIRQNFDNSLPLFFPAVQMDRGIIAAERDAACEEIGSAQSEAKAAEAQLTEMTAARDAAENALESVTNERDLVSEKLDLTLSTLEQRKAELVDTNEALHDTEGKLEQARQEIVVLSEERALAQAEVVESQRKLKKSTVDMVRLQARLAVLITECDAAEAVKMKEKNLERDLSQAQSALQMIKAESDERHRELQATLVKLCAESKEADEARERELQNKMLLDKQEQEFQMLQRELQRNLVHATDRVKALEQSTSWRVTAPLRLLVERLRR